MDADWLVRYMPDRDLGVIEYNGPARSTAPPSPLEIQFQHGRIGENGINGVQNEQVLGLIAVRLRALDQRIPCRENAIALQHIEEAIMWLEHRTALRREQGVEDSYSPHRS